MDQVTLNKLATQFMVNAVNVQPGQNIWVEHLGQGGLPVAEACVAKIKALGAKAFVRDSGSAYLNQFISGKSDDALAAEGAKMLAKMQEMDGYIRVGDDSELAKLTVPLTDYQRYQRLVMHEATEHRVRHTNWLVVRAPTAEFAKACKMETEAFEEFYANACLADYGRMRPAAQPLKDLMGERHNVHILGKDTDLKFQTLGGGSAKACTGQRNLPDGEVFTAPVINSAEGHILFGPSNYNGQAFNSIYLVYEGGRITQAKAENDERTAALNAILDADEGARTIGEFAVAFNPGVLDPTGDILFDEKIRGSIHLAQGQCYEDTADNGGESSVHWDMVHIQRPEYGGGELWFDDLLVRKYGLFVVSELEGLNPDNLG